MTYIDTEILVIGGGIAGTSTAYHLAQHGYEVTLLERNEIASEASGLNAGTIWPTGWRSIPTLQSTLTMGSLEIFKDIQIALGYDIEFRQSGALRIIQTEEQYDFLRKVVLDLSSRKDGVELLTTRESRSIEPELSPEILGCGYYPLGASAHPAKATRALASASQKLGVRILTKHEVTAIKYLDDRTYSVNTQHDVFHSESLILAAGPWCRHLGAMLGLDIPVTPVKAQMFSTEIAPPRLFHVIGAVESALAWHKNQGGSNTSPPKLTHLGNIRLTRHLYGRQMRNGEIIIGGDRQLADAQLPDLDGIQVNQAHAIEILPFIQELKIKRTWAGWMPFTQNLRPLIGKVPQREKLYILTGVYESGFEQGPMAGKLLADYIHNQDSLDLLSEADPVKQVTLLTQV